MKKRAFLCLCLAVFLFVPTFCLSLSAIGYDPESEGRHWEGHAFFERMQRLTGIHVEGSAVGGAKEWAERLRRLGTDTGTDILLKADLSRAEEEALLDEGAIIDLAPYLGECMPNLSALLAENPEWREQIALPDGRIASLPEINPESRQVIVWINTRWLDSLGLSMPEGIGELGNALRAFRDGDPNGNGRQDEIPCDLVGMWELRWLLPYFGIAADDWLMERNPDGSAFFAPEGDAYRSFAETLSGWYAEGLLPGDALTGSHAARAYLSQSSGAESPGLFVSVSPITHVPAEQVMDYQALLMPCGGKTVWRGFSGEVWNGCFAVTAHCQAPDEALRWADALYAEEAAILALAGEEGKDWAWNEDGSWSFMTRGGRTVEDIRRTAILNTGSKMPGLYPAAFAERANSREDQWIAAENRKVRAAVQGASAFSSLPPQARARAAAVLPAVQRCADEGTAEFVMGVTPLNDENWQRWLERMKAAGSGELKAAFGG